MGGVLLPRRVRLIAAGLTLAAAVAGCSSKPEPAAAPPPPPPPAPAEPDINPLTGLAPRPEAPVVFLKIDNAKTARPFQRGLDRADVVYQELVESGATRFLAIYTDGSTGEVGPVRSLRESDLELVTPYGKVIAGFSGANPGVIKTFGEAVKQGAVFDASEEYWRKVRKQPQYRRGEKRVDAFNFFTSPAKLAALYPQAGRVSDIGLTFGDLPAGAAKPEKSVVVPFSDAATVTVKWNGSAWTVLQDGRPMKGFAPDNVIVQAVTIRKSGFKDVTGAPSPYVVTVGGGKSVVLRDGQRIDGTWTRPGVTAGTTYLDAQGQEVPLKPGQTMILLQPSSQRFPAK